MTQPRTTGRRETTFIDLHCTLAPPLPPSTSVRSAALTAGTMTAFCLPPPWPSLHSSSPASRRGLRRSACRVRSRARDSRWRCCRRRMRWPLARAMSRVRTRSPTTRTRRHGFSLSLLRSMRRGRASAPYPERPIRLIVPGGAGGATDAVARIPQPEAQRMLRVPIIIDNHAGAGGTIGTMETIRSAPDGYTLLVASLGHPRPAAAARASRNRRLTRCRTARPASARARI